MLNNILLRTIVLFLATSCVVLSIQSPEKQTNEQEIQAFSAEQNHRHERFKRAVRKPGFFRTLFSVIYEQWADTKDTLSSVSNMINENVVDDREAARRRALPSKVDANGSTTEAPYILTRSELNRILGRNLRGIARLYNLELNDALKTSYRNNKEFRKNVSAEVSKFL